ncbi:MAG: phage tail sheath family protein, partial [Lachnospiraceae bacterium]|nr:phage tail sheath family protein [Lachnospiraceae bacterium]
MAEYLSPGVYVEEFESGGKPMEGVGTSTAGFVGLAERGAIEGVPQLVTNFADFKRKYGGYLSENEFGENRFLAYAVEHFFINGGARAYISRVAPQDAKAAEGALPADAPVLTFTAKNPGSWGNNLNIVIAPASKAKTQILEILETAGGKRYHVKNGAGFTAGDIVMYTDKTTVTYNRVVKCQDNIIEFASEFDESVVDQDLLPTRTVSTCELSLEVRMDDQVELYENVSFNIEAPNYIEKKTAKSDMIAVACQIPEGETVTSPFLSLAQGDE